MTNILDEDWIKRSRWDLPRDPDKFLAILLGDAPLKARVAQFMKLPAAGPMPASLRKELQRRGLLEGG